MSARELHTAIATAWAASTLNATFNSLWPSDDDRSRYPVLHDGEASPGQPFPYCVIEVAGGVTRARMSNGTERKEIHDVPIQFNIHARIVDGDARSAKQIAADMADAVMAIFGGHPTTVPTALTIANGNHLLAEYDRDYGVRTGDDEYQWIVSLVMRLDVAMAA